MSSWVERRGKEQVASGEVRGAFGGGRPESEPETSKSGPISAAAPVSGSVWRKDQLRTLVDGYKYYFNMMRDGVQALQS